MAVDLRNFIFHSGFPIDKVIGIKSGTYTIKNTYEISPVLKVPHGLPGKPLGITVFSNYSDFRDTYDEGWPTYHDLGEYGISVRTTSTNIEIYGWSLNNSDKLVYWRTILLESNETSMEVPLTAASADMFQFNSDYNYSKLVKEGSVTSNTTITHGLGFIPQVLIWMTNGTYIERVTFMDNTDRVAELTSNTLVLRPGPGVNKLFYRIYGDD